MKRAATLSTCTVSCACLGCDFTTVHVVLMIYTCLVLLCALLKFTSYGLKTPMLESCLDSPAVNQVTVLKSSLMHVSNVDFMAAKHWS